MYSKEKEYCIAMRPEEPSPSQPEAVGTVVKNEYRAEQIQILEGLEAVRKRPAMYIGNTSSAGLTIWSTKS